MKYQRYWTTLENYGLVELIQQKLGYKNAQKAVRDHVNKNNKIKLENMNTDIKLDKIG